MASSLISTEESVATEWSTLPESLWLSIFSRCDSMDLLAIKDVCLQWRRIAKDLSLVSHLEFVSNGLKSQMKKIIHLLSFVGHDLRVLRIRNSECEDRLMSYRRHDKLNPMTEEMMTTLRDKCQQLSRLSLEDITDDNVSYNSLPQRLTHLSLIGCRSGGNQSKPLPRISRMFDPNEIHGSTKYQSIVYLNVSHINVFESQMCRSINGFVSLKYLYLNSLYRVNDGGITDITPKLVSQLIVIDLEGTDIEDESFQYILNNGHSLEELYMGTTKTSANLDFSKSVAKRLKKLCLLNSCVQRDNVLNILRSHSSLQSLYCCEDIKETIDSPVLKTKTSDVVQEIDGLNETCLHYISDKRFDAKD